MNRLLLELFNNIYPTKVLSSHSFHCDAESIQTT